jgi:3-oxoadipate enol-lactonase
MGTMAVPRTTLYFDERGSGDPILWLQGLGADHTAWSPQLARFGARYRCLAPDNRGAGRTEPGGPLDIPLMAADALALLDARAEQAPAHVVGLSMGASIAQELALAAPGRVRSLVLVSASAYLEPRLRELLAAWRDIYPRVPAAVFQRQANPWLFSWRFFEKAGAAETAMRYAERAAAPAEWFVAQVDAALAYDARERLGTVRVPTLVVMGAEDIMVPPRLGRELADVIPGARFVEIAGGGHSINLEQQRAFYDVTAAFFDQH